MPVETSSRCKSTHKHGEGPKSLAQWTHEGDMKKGDNTNRNDFKKQKTTLRVGLTTVLVALS